MSKIRIAINGYGRIGRNVLRALYESKRTNEFEIVAVNDLGGDLEVQALITQRDSVQGYFPHSVEVVESQGLKIDGQLIKFYAKRDPRDLPWAELKVDVVMECTGVFTSKAKAIAHIEAGAKKVLLSAPGEKDVDATIVYGVNHGILTKDMLVVSNASCTTNCLAPVAKVLNDSIGIEKGLMTTIHAFTNDQVLADVYHSDARRARSAVMSMIPTKTGAAAAVGLVLPELKGKLDGLAVRVPTANVSLVDLTFTASRATTVDEVNSLLKAASEGELKHVLGYNKQKLVSIDFNHTSYSSTFDSTQTRVDGNLVKIFSWYDNEWGFSNRMLDTASALVNAK
ncbi:MAG: type I glyceraldehyde-3-phosphate dehydrogenase [Neisseriaceae bacterium]|jgi:glyceraldehyde 3-phosphate dehydrogenase|nr:MAG: type I glyceraldehyde-3-phosphate dehydrogenase [Neisseriaceae bacterium]